MAIESVAIVGRGAVGMLYGSIAERNLGSDAVEFVMDDERSARHAGETPPLWTMSLTSTGAPASRMWSRRTSAAACG